MRHKPKDVPYRNQKTIYEIAAKQRGQDYMKPGFFSHVPATPLPPKIALYSTLCAVLSLKNEKRQIELLGEEAYNHAQQLIKSKKHLCDVASEVGMKYFPVTEEFIQMQHKANEEYVDRQIRAKQER